MSDVSIKVQGLSKRYRIGELEKRSDTIISATGKLLLSPLRNLRRLKRLSAFGADSEQQAADIIWALRDVNFDVEEGEIVGLVGANGAGKSTLLKILSRITNPTDGQAEIFGRVSSLLEVGTGFHPELTGRENVYLNGTILGMSRKEVQRKFEEIVEFSGIEQFIDTAVKRYSSGMKVRLAFSVAAHLEPEILLVDEVLAVGDMEFQRKCIGRMEDVAQAGRTVMFVSHNMSAINRLCPRSLLLRNGTVVMDGRSPDVTAEYLGHGGGDNGVRVWPLDEAPGSDELRLTYVGLTTRKGERASVVSTSDELDLEIGYHVNVPNLKFRCALHFYTQGVCAFASIEPREIVREREGYYRSKVSIPAHLLTEGQYMVSVAMYTSHAMRHWYVRAGDVFAFEVYDPITGDSARGDMTQHLIGVVRPKLDWDVAYDDAPVLAAEPLGLARAANGNA